MAEADRRGAADASSFVGLSAAAAAEMAEFRARLAQLAAAAANMPPPTPAQQRALFEMEHAPVPPADGCRIEAIAAGNVRGEKITPDDAMPGKALLYHHGGGHVFGSARSHRHFVSRLAVAARVTAYNMDYALAPEQPFPAALGDAVANLDHVLGEGFELGNIVIGGESAGGNLTAALLVELQRLGRPLPAGAYLLSPWLDLTHGGDSYRLRAAHDPMIAEAGIETVSAYYAGSADRRDPRVSPLFADPAGWPPLLLQVGADEVLLSDSTGLATRAALAGVDVTLRVWPHMVHAWPAFHHRLPESGAAGIREAAAWIAARLQQADGGKA